MDENDSVPVKKQARRESIIMRDHERTVLSCKKISQRADHTIDKIEKDIDSNRNSQRQFFQARRKIA